MCGRYSLSPQESREIMDILQQVQDKFKTGEVFPTDPVPVLMEAGAELAALAVESGTRQVALAHLSAENNTPSRARQTVCRRLSAMGCDPERDIALWVAPRSEMGPVCQMNREEAVLC